MQKYQQKQSKVQERKAQSNKGCQILVSLIVN